MDCWKCGRKISEAPLKIGFRAVCPHCGIDLHSCKSCRYYAPGKPNDCAVPGTEFIRDREANNFCEEFKPKFVTSHSESKKKNFNDLFKDDADES